MPVDEPIRILRVIARLNIGGPAIHVITLSEKFSKGRYQTCLVCGRVSEQEGDMSYLASEMGVEPVLVDSLGRKISPLGDLFSLSALRRLIEEFSPHIIHTHTAKAGTLGRLAALSLHPFKGQGRKIKLVHTFHGHVFHSYFGPLKSSAFIQIERFLAKFTDRIVVVSPLQKEEICGRFGIVEPEKVTVIPLGFDLSSFAKERSSQEGMKRKLFPDASGRTTVVGIVGRLTRVKNHRLFLEAAQRLKQDGDRYDFRFLVVGDGELKQELMNYSARLGIRDRVVFMGWQREMASIYAMMDMVALTSLNEGTPVTLIEAMAAGRPVLATAVGGVPDLLGPIDNGEAEGYKIAERGLLIPSGEADPLAGAILFGNENREKVQELAHKASRFVLEHFSIDRLVKDIERLYQGLMAP